METHSLILCDLPGEPLRPPGFFLAGFRAIVLADAADLVSDEEGHAAAGSPPGNRLRLASQEQTPRLSPYQREEASKRRAGGETLASIAKSYAVDVSMISRIR
jgi:hypothetical protein